MLASLFDGVFTLAPSLFPSPPSGRGQGEGRSRPLGEMIRKSRMTVLSRVVPRRLSLIVAHGLIGAMLEQEVDHLGLAVQSSFHQRGESQAAGALPRVHGRAPLEAQASDENRAR